MDKNAKSPIPERTQAWIKQARELQDEVNRIQGGKVETKFVKGTAEPPIKK